MFSLPGRVATRPSSQQRAVLTETHAPPGSGSLRFYGIETLNDFRDDLTNRDERVQHFKGRTRSVARCVDDAALSAAWHGPEFRMPVLVAGRMRSDDIARARAPTS